MALPLPPGLTPPELSFLSEATYITIIPRQPLAPIPLLLDAATPALEPPFPAQLPLWLALLLHRQRRADIRLPAWLSVPTLERALGLETAAANAAALAPGAGLPPPDPQGGTVVVSPPFVRGDDGAGDGDALPYHWREIAHLLLTRPATGAATPSPDETALRHLLRDVADARGAKLRRGMRVLGPGAGVRMNGVGGAEVAEVRAWVGGTVDGLR